MPEQPPGICLTVVPKPVVPFYTIFILETLKTPEERMIDSPLHDICIFLCIDLTHGLNCTENGQLIMRIVCATAIHLSILHELGMKEHTMHPSEPEIIWKSARRGGFCARAQQATCNLPAGVRMRRPCQMRTDLWQDKGTEPATTPASSIATRWMSSKTACMRTASGRRRQPRVVTRTFWDLTISSPKRRSHRWSLVTGTGPWVRNSWGGHRARRPCLGMSAASP